MASVTPGTVSDVDDDVEKGSVANGVEPKLEQQLSVLEGRYRQKWCAFNLSPVYGKVVNAHGLLLRPLL